MNFEGKAWVFGDDIDTDVIISGKYLRTEDSKVWGSHVFEVLGDYSQKIQQGDIIIGRDNFGCGSSREQAAIAIKESGAAAVIARSFGRIFFRNAINIGLPVCVCPDIQKEKVSDGDVIQIDLEKSKVTCNGTVLAIEQIPEFMRNILNAGGLINYYNHTTGS